MFKKQLQRAVEGQTFSEQEAKRLMDDIMQGKATSSQIASLLTVMKLRGNTVDELTGFVRSMREHATAVKHDEELLLDTCGTGGDGSSTFNISTTVAIVLAAAGIPVAKHGNRSVSSKSGSADVLEKLGVPIQVSPEQAVQALKTEKLCFLFAPLYHSAMKHAMIPRKEIGFRTVFNILGPLSNPADSNCQLIGVYDRALAEKMGQTLKRLGTKRAMLVTGKDGLDECSISTETDVVELKDGKISHYVLSPEQVGLERADKNALTVSTVDESAQLIKSVLQGKAPKAAIDIVLLNAGAALYIVGKTESIKDGIKRAKALIDDGTAYRKLTELQKKEITIHA